MVGVSEDKVNAETMILASNSTATIRAVSVGIGLDSTTVNSATLVARQAVGNTQAFPTRATYSGYPGVGKHTLVWLEYGAGADTQTWAGTGGTPNNQSGIVGGCFA